MSPEQKAEAVEQFKRVLDAAQQLGANKIIALPHNPFDIDIPVLLGKATSQVWSVDFPEGLDWKQNWHDMVDVLRQFAEACAASEMRVALEPHPHRMMHNSAGMQRIIDQIDSEAIGLNLDPSHLFPMGELPNMVAYEVGDRIFHTHISDNDGQTNAHWRPGKGKVDWRAFLIALKNIGYDGPLSLELEDVPGAAGYPGFNTHLKASAAGGSIFGRFYDLSGRECATEFRERAVALTFDDLRKIPERISLTMGAHRIQAILGLMHGELITTLVTDRDTATAVLDKRFASQGMRSDNGKRMSATVAGQDQSGCSREAQV